MANTYNSVNMDAPPGSGGGGGGSAPYTESFTTVSWNLSGGDYVFTVLATAHEKGTALIIQVEELVAGDYQQVDVFIENDDGDVTLRIGNDSRFNGRVVIQGE